MNVTPEEKILKDYVTDLYAIQDTVPMTEWELEFVSDMNRCSNLKNLSEKQKSAILKMAEKYEL